MECLQKKDHSVNCLISTHHKPRGECQDGRVEEICECECARNQIVLLSCDSLAPVQKFPLLLQVWEQAACTDGLPVLATDLLCETKCEVICCDQNPGQTGNHSNPRREEEVPGRGGQRQGGEGSGLRDEKLRVLSSSALYHLFHFVLLHFSSSFVQLS